MRVAPWVIAAGLLAFTPAGFADAQSKPEKPAQPIAESAKKATKKLPPAEEAAKEYTPAEAECAWVGKRVTGLLARDDVQAAGEFLRFYTMFHCPVAHLGLAFRCAVRDGNEGAGEAAPDRIERCWQDPTTRIFPNKVEPSPAKAQSKGSEPKAADPKAADKQKPAK
jgi:hypothetical protein